jgi:hypothetical protein
MSELDKQSDLRADWTEHPYASIVKKRLAQEHAVAESALKTACQQSTDPRVRACYERLEAARHYASLIENGVK